MRLKATTLMPACCATLLFCALTLPACAQQMTPQQSTLQQNKPQTSTTTPPASQPASSNKAFTDCSLIDFKDIDSTSLTKAELVQKMEQDFADNLNNNEKCMSEAVTAGAERISAAGASAAQTAGATATTQQVTGLGDSDSQQPQNAQAGQEQISATSKPTAKGQGQQGSSAVCDTIKQGLAAATTESEKTHFRGLMDQYGCKT